MLQSLLLTAALMQSTGIAGAFITPPAAPAGLGYDAIETRGRRRSIGIDTRREDEILNSAQRQQLQANSRDIRRNFAVASWLIRKHLDFVSRFRFQARTADNVFNRDYEQAVAEWSKRGNVEVSRRFRLAKLIRIVEAHRTIDGDHGLLKLAGGLLQLIESDRIRNPRGLAPSDQWVQGVKLSAQDEPLAYAIHKRKRGGGFEFEREVPARNFRLHGYVDRVDQVRGVSPLAAGINSLRDVYENFSFALARAKVEQLMGLVLTSTIDDDGTTGFGQHTAQTAEGAEGEHPDGPKYDVDLGRGPWKLELDPGEDLKVLQSTNPSSQFQAFHNAVLMVVLKSLDLPYSFYDEAHTNFHGSLRAAQLYMRSARDRIEDNQELLTHWLHWRTRVEIANGNFSLPGGAMPEQLATSWVPDGVPWWDKSREITGDRLAVGSALDNPQRICADHGTDFFDNVDRIAEAVAYAKEKLGPHGFELSFDVAGPALMDAHRPEEEVPADAR